MNRRSFLATMLRLGVGAAILPAAVTYARTWKATAGGILVADYVPVPLAIGDSVLASTTRRLFDEQAVLAIKAMAGHLTKEFKDYCDRCGISYASYD